MHLIFKDFNPLIILIIVIITLFWNISHNFINDIQTKRNLYHLFISPLGLEDYLTLQISENTPSQNTHKIPKTLLSLPPLHLSVKVSNIMISHSSPVENYPNWENNPKKVVTICNMVLHMKISPLSVKNTTMSINKNYKYNPKSAC